MTSRNQWEGDLPIFCATYFVEMPYLKNRSHGQSDYYISFLTEKITHPEVVDPYVVLADARRRIEHLDGFMETLFADDWVPSPQICFAGCGATTLEDALEESRLTPDTYILAKTYGDEEDVGEIANYLLPDDLLSSKLK